MSSCLIFGCIILFIIPSLNNGFIAVSIATRRHNLFSETLSQGVYDQLTISVGNHTIVSVEAEAGAPESQNAPNLIRLTDIQSGWGNGAHPTTKLCLDFVSSVVQKGDSFLDYGTGSGILSILAAKMGASKCMAVDIDEDSLRAARNNVITNGVDDIIEVLHTKSIYLGDGSFSESDITVANILPGALNRLVGTIWMLTKPGGIICLSGMRPHELGAIRSMYSPFVDLATEETRQSSHELYGKMMALT